MLRPRQILCFALVIFVGFTLTSCVVSQRSLEKYSANIHAKIERRQFVQQELDDSITVFTPRKQPPKGGGAEGNIMAWGCKGKVDLSLMPSQTHLKSLYFPRGVGKEGDPVSIAISPDKDRVYIAGATGYSFEKSSSVYVLDVNSGEMITRLKGFKSPSIQATLFDDGKHLIVWGKSSQGNEMAVFDTATNLPVWTNAGSPVVASDVTATYIRQGETPNGVLFEKISSSPGGVKYAFILVNEKGANILASWTASGTKTPFVHLNPDGSMILTNHAGSKWVIRSTKDFSVVATTPVESSDAMIDEINRIAFSPDGTSIYYRQSAPGGTYEYVQWDYVGNKTLRTGKLPGRWISNYRGTIVSTDDSTYKRYQLDEKGIFVEQKNPVGKKEVEAVLLHPRAEVVVSETGLEFDVTKTVDFTFTKCTGSQYKSDSKNDREMRRMLDAQLKQQMSASKTLISGSLADLSVKTQSAPITRGDMDAFICPEIFTEEGRKKRKAKFMQGDHASAITYLDGFPLKNDTMFLMSVGMTSNKYRLLPCGSDEFGRRKWQDTANESGAAYADKLWEIALPARLHGAALSGNGKVLVSCDSIGVIRWHDASNGRTLLSLLSEGDEWVFWTPQGYYDASPKGDDLLGFYNLNGLDAVPDVVLASQFERLLYRPEIILAVVDGIAKGDLTVQQETSSVEDIIRQNRPPLVAIESPGLADEVDAKQVPLSFSVRSKGPEVTDVQVYVNDIPQLRPGDRSVAGQTGLIRKSVPVVLNGQENAIRIEASTTTSMGLGETMILFGDKNTGKEKGTLYLLSVGVQEFPKVPAANLDYADADARALSEKLVSSGAFAEVNAKVLRTRGNLPPTKAAIEQSLNFLSEAGPADTVIIYLASHGLSDNKGDFYFLPQDVTPRDIARLRAGGPFPSLVGWDAFFNALRNTAGKRLLIVDTCQAEKVEGTLSYNSLLKRSASSHFAILAASKGNEKSQEYPRGGHGLFTYSLLEGLSGDADDDKDGVVTLNELFLFSKEFVDTNRQLKTISQTPQLQAPESLKSMPLAVVR